MNSLRASFAPYWESIQRTLFPRLEQALGPLTGKQQQLVQTLEVIRIERLIPRYFRAPGRPPKDRAAMARAFVAKAVYDLPSTRALNLPAMLDDLPTACDVGTKKNSKGYKDTWVGYKLHIDVADGQIPISWCAVRRRHSSAGANPARQLSLQPVTSVPGISPIDSTSYGHRHYEKCNRSQKITVTAGFSRTLSNSVSVEPLAKLLGLATWRSPRFSW